MKDSDFKSKLTKEQYHVLREKDTEMPFSSELLKNKSSGIYACAACGQALFASDAKFDSGTGWPSFDKPANTKHITLKEDSSQGMKRIEVMSKRCKSHLGHVFPDGPTQTGERYCINGCALNFRKKKSKILKRNKNI